MRLETGISFSFYILMKRHINISKMNIFFLFIQFNLFFPMSLGAELCEDLIDVRWLGLKKNAGSFVT